jgi:dethiobiotin synthetase
VLMLDLMARLGLPVVLVARTALGTINHTLLSLAALRGRGIAVAGAVLVGPPSAGNRQAIEQHGGVPILLEIPPLGVLSRVAIAEAAKAMPDFQACVPA